MAKRRKKLICANCGTQNPLRAKYCSYCGESISAGAWERRKGVHTGMGTASLVLGIVGIFLFAIILGPLAIIFGAIAWSRDQDSYGLAGMILGIIGFILWIFLLIILLV